MKDCGCRIVHKEGFEFEWKRNPILQYEIKYCPLHAAAERMMDFIQKLADLIEDEDAGKEPIDEWVIEAGGIIGSIAKAEAEKEA